MRGKIVKTTVPDTSAPCPHDKVNRQFRAPEPNLLWVSDFTSVSTWQGFVYVAFVIDTFADRILGWRVSRSAKANFVLDALEQALHDRRPVQKEGLMHHPDRGGQYLSIRYTERLTEAGIQPSVGSVGDSYDNALAKTIDGLCRTERIHHQGPWRNMQDLEMATLRWLDWFNHRRLLGPIGNIPPAEAEETFYAQRDVRDMVAGNEAIGLRENRGGSNFRQFHHGAKARRCLVQVQCPDHATRAATLAGKCYNRQRVSAPRLILMTGKRILDECHETDDGLAIVSALRVVAPETVKQIVDCLLRQIEEDAPTRKRMNGLNTVNEIARLGANLKAGGHVHTGSSAEEIDAFLASLARSARS